MKLKSYFAASVEAAMVLARGQLGPEAMLVHSKRTSAETRHLGHYEVVFALEDDSRPIAAAPPPPAESVKAAASAPKGKSSPADLAAAGQAARPLRVLREDPEFDRAVNRRAKGTIHSAGPPESQEGTPPARLEPEMPAFAQFFAPPRDTAIHELSLELEALKKRIESMSGVLASPPDAQPARVKRDPKAEFRRQLEEADVLPNVVDAIMGDTTGSGSPDTFQDALLAFVKVDATLGVPGAPRRIVALAGPPGAGKTTALVKLATRYGLTARRSMMLISTDVYRVGAAEQLRLYASILGVGFQTVETPLGLAQVLEEHRHKELILIDTPGWAHRDTPEVLELANYIGSDTDIDVHLVLPASNRAIDLARFVDRYSVFQPAKLLFTRLDETGRHGPLLNECHRTGKPVSFLSAGEQIPEDLEPATARRIVELILQQPASAPAGQTVLSGEERG